MLLLLAHSYIGYYLDYYNKYKTFDRYFHAAGAFTLSLLFYYLLGNFIEYGGSALFRSLYIFLSGIALGAIYEVVEFSVDRKRGSNMQRGLKDTDFDIIANIVGSFASALFAYFVIL